MEKKSVFDALYEINVQDKTEKKVVGGTELTYLSWPFAWAEVKRRYPDAHYEILRFNNLPYICDPATGYMVFTNVTIEGVTHEMWLPVMDGANNAMKSEPYTVQTKYKEISVRAATMMDVNKTIMRCLVKNLAMFGMGLYIYAGEDLPIPEIERTQKEKEETVKLYGTIKAQLLAKGYPFDAKAQRQLDSMDLAKMKEYQKTLATLPDKKKEDKKE